MYKLVAINIEDGKEYEYVFQSHKEATIYKQYHFTFGDWSYGSEWVFDIDDSLKEFVVDSASVIKEGVVAKSYLISRKWKIKEAFVSQAAGTVKSWIRFRAARDTLLKGSDWTQLADAPMTTADRVDWKKYRQYLRDVPSLHTDVTIENAKVASFEEWRAGVR